MECRRDSEKDLGFIIKQIDMSIKQQIDARLAKYDLTLQQSRVLLYIAYQEGQRVSQRSIERYMKVTHPTVAGVIRRLEEKGFVTTSEGVEDRRLTMVELTDQSQRLFAGLEKDRIDMERQMYRDISAEERDELLRLLRKVRNNIGEGTMVC